MRTELAACFVSLGLLSASALLAGACTTTTANNEDADAAASSSSGSPDVEDDGAVRDAIADGATPDAATEADASACLGEGEPPLDCSSLQLPDGGAGCTANSDEFLFTCAQGEMNFKSAVAHAIKDCLLVASSCDDPACFPAAVARACADETAVSFCAGLPTAAECSAGEGDTPPFELAPCVALAQAMPSEARERITGCVQGVAFEHEGACTDADVAACFDPNSYGYAP